LGHPVYNGGEAKSLGQENIDLNEVAAIFAKKFVDDVINSASSSMSDAFRKAQIALKAGFQSYIDASISRSSRVKTLLDTDHLVTLSDIYVPLTFRSSRKMYSDNELLLAIHENKLAIIAGTAGGGKSIFLRHLNISLVNEFSDAFPIYYELRSMDDGNNSSLLEAIYSSVAKHISVLTLDDFRHFVLSGRFTLLLDGFDEIDHDRRETFVASLKELVELNDKISIIITTRPTEFLTSIPEFVVYHVCPMNITQTVSLLKKLDYDPEIKELFIGQVTRSLFVKHSDFMSVPLLATMMLLTFSQYSDIPDKIYIYSISKHLRCWFRGMIAARARGRANHTLDCLLMTFIAYSRTFAENHMWRKSFHLQKKACFLT
jgi:hypothetical protein